ncbi:MAG: hypothetical protein LQ351_007290 [Letrouitia transgressa]|nr:MAG: hypothetical protein LQ351_007290 [Letrouitia transgressa]
MPASTSGSPSTMDAFASTQPCYTTAFQSAFAPASAAIMSSASVNSSSALNAAHPQRDQLAFSTLQGLYFPRNISTASPTQTLDTIFTLTDPALSNLSVLLRYPYADDADFSLFLSQIIFKLLSWYAKISSSPVMRPPRDSAYLPAGPDNSNPMMVQLLIDKLRQVDSVVQEFEGGLKRRADGNTRAMYFAIVASMRERLREMVAGVAGKRKI